VLKGDEVQLLQIAEERQQQLLRFDFNQRHAAPSRKVHIHLVHLLDGWPRRYV
jgi:hypothetical protein